MSRLASTRALSAWLDAEQRGSESRATSVLACALLSSPAFAKSVLERLSANSDGEVLVELEVPTGHSRNRIDLELSVVDRGQRLLQRAWIEVKIGSRLAGERTGSSTTPERRSQLVRYRTALDARDAVRHPAFRSPLAVLLPWVDEKHERQQIEATGTTVLLWQTVAELAAFRAHQIAGKHWRRIGRRPEASLSLRTSKRLCGCLRRE